MIISNLNTITVVCYHGYRHFRLYVRLTCLADYNKQDADSALTSGRCIGHRLVYMQISCKSR